MGRELLIETLEHRSLLSISVVGHQINVIGAPNSPNTIVVGLNPSDTAVDVTVSYPTKKGKVITQSKSIPLSRGIGLINIGGGNASDSIRIDQTNGPFPILTHINTHNGNDTVLGGDEPDRIICGNGIDYVNSGQGNDSMQAGRGPDTLIGGDGKDHFQSGPNHGDVLLSGNGNNRFVDPFGHVVIHAGSGHNTYVLKSLQLDPDTSYTPGKDTLQQWVPASNDNVWNDVLNGLLDYGSFL